MESLREYFDIKKIENSISAYEETESSFLNNYIVAFNNRDAQFVTQSVERFLIDGKIVIDSPYDGSSSVAVANTIKMAGGPNYILFKDINEKYWMLVQDMSFIDCVIYDDKIFYTSIKGLAKTALRCLNEVIDEFSSNVCKFDSDLKGFIVQQNRPFHFFYDQLKTAIYYDNVFEDRLLKKYPFFFCKPFIEESQLLKNTIRVNDYNEPGVFIKSTMFLHIKVDHHESDWARESMQVMEDKIENSCNSYQLDRSSYKLVIWLGITGQKRSWLEQVAGYENIIKNLSSVFGRILVVVDGLTSISNTVSHFEEDEDIFSKIHESVKEYADLKNIIGFSYETKISICKSVDFFIANAGFGSFVPLKICKKNGVLHSNKLLEGFPDDYEARNQLVYKVDDKYVGIPKEERGKRMDYINYRICWKVIYNLLIQVINESWALNIDEVDYNQEDFKYLNEEPLIALSLLENVFKRDFQFNREQYINLIRDIGLVYEKYNKLEVASQLMKEARFLRPNGAFIAAKVQEYESKLKS